MSSASSSAATTIYVSNLDDKVRKNELRRVVYLLFSEFGVVIDVAMSLASETHRGQAYVTMENREAALTAIRTLQSRDVYGRRLRAQQAKQTSFSVDVVGRARSRAAAARQPTRRPQGEKIAKKEVTRSAAGKSLSGR